MYLDVALAQYITFDCFLFQIDKLAQSHPALLTLKSVDLSPASWMAVSSLSRKQNIDWKKKYIKIPSKDDDNVW